MEIIQINKDVDTSICKRAHTALVVSVWINVVYSNRIGAQILHLSGIARALFGIDQGVVRDQLICDSYPILACIFGLRSSLLTFDEVLLARAVEELVSKSRDCGDCANLSDEARDESDCGQHLGWHLVWSLGR